MSAYSCSSTHSLVFSAPTSSMCSRSTPDGSGTAARSSFLRRRRCPSRRTNHAGIVTGSCRELGLGLVAHEARVLGLEDELDLAQPPVAVLGDPDLRDAGLLGVLGVVVL